MGPVSELRLTDPELDFWVEVRLRQVDLAGTPDVGVSTDRDLAVLLALSSLGREVARRMVSSMATSGWTQST